MRRVVRRPCEFLRRKPSCLYNRVLPIIPRTVVFVVGWSQYEGYPELLSFEHCVNIYECAFLERLFFVSVKGVIPPYTLEGFSNEAFYVMVSLVIKYVFNAWDICSMANLNSFIHWDIFRYSETDVLEQPVLQPHLVSGKPIANLASSLLCESLSHDAFTCIGQMNWQTHLGYIVSLTVLVSMWGCKTDNNAS